MLVNGEMGTESGGLAPHPPKRTVRVSIAVGHSTDSLSTCTALPLKPQTIHPDEQLTTRKWHNPHSKEDFPS